MLNSENAGILNSSSYYINVNGRSENFSVSKSPGGFFFFPILFSLFCFNIVEKRGILSTIIITLNK